MWGNVGAARRSFRRERHGRAARFFGDAEAARAMTFEMWADGGFVAIALLAMYLYFVNEDKK